jgi:D-alanyl-D-alanine carboxypeptidase (penicillin-binding protein 5/6)
VPQTRGTVYRRRRFVLVSGLTVVVALAFYLPLTLLAPLTSIAPSNASYTAPTSVPPVLSMPGYGASAISAVGFPGVLTQGGSTAPLPIASITKIVTSLVVLDKMPLAAGDPGPQIRFTPADEVIRKAYLARNGEVRPVPIGGTMSERDVMTVTLVASANNYARALVDWAFGSEASFLPVANAWLAQNGMKSTTLTDATGLNSANRSTPADLIELGKLALANPVVAALIKTAHTTVPFVGAIDNTNTLLGTLGIDGVKTGTLDGAGASLLFSSDYQFAGRTIKLIGVILDGPNHPTVDTQIKTLIKTVRSGFKSVTLTTAGQRFATYRSAWGPSTQAVATKSRSVVVWAGTPVTSRITTIPIVLAAKGAIVGSAIFTVSGETITVPLALSGKLADPGAWWRLTNPAKLL